MGDGSRIVRVDSFETRVKSALDIICTNGATNNPEHKDWIIDQVTRALTGCPHFQGAVINTDGDLCWFFNSNETEEYSEFVKDYCEGSEGPDTYPWPVGIAP